MIIPGGRWCDVTLLPGGRAALIYATANALETILLELTDDGAAAAGLSLRSIDVSRLAPPVSYTRAAADGTGKIATIGQNQLGRAVLHIEGRAPTDVLEEIDGERCCEVVGLAVGWRVYVVKPANPRAPRRVETYVLDQAGQVIGASAEATPTSQGFLSGDYGPLLTDAGRFYEPIPRRALLCLPESVDGEVYVGQHPEDPPRVAAARLLTLADKSVAAQRAVLFTGGGAGTVPHVVKTPAGRYWVCAWVDGGVWVETYRSADSFPWADEAPVIVPPVIVDPEPPIIVPPEVRTMRIPDAVFDTIAAVYDKHSTTEDDQRRPPAGEDNQRAMQEKVCQTVRAKHGTQWGWKRSAGPASADAIAFRERTTDTAFFVWDCCRDAGGPDRKFTLGRGAEGELVSQTFIPVAPIDDLAQPDQPTDPGQPTDPTVPPVITPPASGDVVERLARIEAKQDAILARLSQPLGIELRVRP